MVSRGHDSIYRISLAQHISCMTRAESCPLLNVLYWADVWNTDSSQMHCILEADGSDLS